MGKSIDQPAGGHARHPGTDQRNPLSTIKQPVISVPERPQDKTPVHPASLMRLRSLARHFAHAAPFDHFGLLLPCRRSDALAIEWRRSALLEAFGRFKVHDFWLPRFVVEVFLLSWAILRGIGNASIE